ncbi:MAG: hypothetical protein KKE76_10055 [Gammaproteobacteria bacterium]|nr:hypothetical protein [Gammaproteobacteria bacterium]
MDRFTRNYSVILGVIVLIVLALILYENPEVSELNNLLEQNSEVAGYPYEFKVLRLQNGIAIMSTPRSSEFPVYRALGIIFPNLANRAQDDPDVMQAQQEMARVQKRATAIVMESGKVTSIQWELDKNWLSQHGVQMN